MEIVIPNLKGVPYDLVQAVRIIDPQQMKLYLKHGLKPLDVYYSPDVIVMVFDKKESYPYYKEYQNHTLE